MGVTTCKDCGHIISESAKACPYCHKVQHISLSTWKVMKDWLSNLSTGKAVAGFAFIFIVAVIGHGIIADKIEPIRKEKALGAAQKPTPKQPEQELLSYEVLSEKDVSIAGCTRIAVSILVPSGAENNIPAIKRLITRILNNKSHFCEYSVYALIKGKEYIPIIYGKYIQENRSITFHSNEKIFYDMGPSELALDTVKSLPCSEGGTIEQYLTKKAEIPAVEDLGWNIYPKKDGFDIERLLLLDKRMSLEYRWHVDRTGQAKPVNGKAMGITPGYFSPDPKIKSRREYQGSYKDWQPYKDYLKMDDKYKSPAYEKSLKDSYEAEKIVKNLPCSKGGTLDQYFSKNRHPQLKDLGWNEYPGENSVDVVREFLGQTNILEYRWHVDKSGKAKAVNAEAIGITRE